eukprot:jgi/Tetstr1/439195/TSEL_027638.t1
MACRASASICAWLLHACFLLGAIYGAPTPPWLEKMDGVRRKLEKLHIPTDHGTCVPRVHPAAGLPQKARVGVVLVACMEDLSTFDAIGCMEGRLRYHIYLKCGRTKADVQGSIQRLRRCSSVTEVPSTIYTDLSWGKEHSEFLEHIISRYDRLEDRLIFASVRIGSEALSGVVNFEDAVDTALKGAWAYKPLWPAKLSVQFDQCPTKTCNTPQFGRELCALYKRYTCEAECYSCPHRSAWFDVPRALQGRAEVSRCFFPNPLSTFIASAHRIRQLPQPEYMWLRQWVQSWQEDGVGVLRHMIGERLWPVLLGCPEDIHYNSTDGGCTESMRFLSGTRREPPEEMIDDGLVHSLPLHPAKHLNRPDKHTNKYPYPMLRSPKYGTYRLITFVATFSVPVRVRTLLQLLKGTAGSLLHFHPSARFILLVRSDLMSELQQRLGPDMDWFAGRLELLPMHMEHGAGFGSQRSAGDLQGAFWTEACQLEMAAGFLRDITVDGTHDPSRNYGHIVFMPLNTIVLDHLWEAFHGHGDFVIALPAQPIAHQPLDTRFMIVHRRHIRTASGVFSEAVQAIAAGGGATTFAGFIKNRLLGCVTGRQMTAASTLPPNTKFSTLACDGAVPASPWQVAVAGEGDEGEGEAAGGRPAVGVRLLPCRLWAALHLPSDRQDLDMSTPELKDACRMSFKNSIIAQLAPPNGFYALRVFHKMRELGDPSRGRAYMEQL